MPRPSSQRGSSAARIWQIIAATVPVAFFSSIFRYGIYTFVNLYIINDLGGTEQQWTAVSQVAFANLIELVGYGTSFLVVAGCCAAFLVLTRPSIAGARQGP